jgi:uncharacterized protein (TIGR03663 family)
MSGAKQRRPRPATAARRQAAAETQRAAARLPAETSWLLQGKKWQWAALIILVVAAALRFYDLDLVPLHHDEGVNGQFLTALFRGGTYRYDPANYHGPSLYYLGLVVTTLNAFLFGKAGLSTAAIRCVTAIFGTATVWLALKLRRYLGAYGAPAAALLLALSPGMIYFSRYFIHEMLFVFFTLALVAALLFFYETARPAHLMLAAASAAMLFATKETAVISAAVLLLAWVLMLGYFGATAKWRKQHADSRSRVPETGPPSPAGPWLARVGGLDRFMYLLLAAVALFAAIYVALYSSFGDNFPKGVYDSLATFQYWTKTSGTAHTHDALTCLKWLHREEWPALWLGVTGCLFAVCRGRNRFAVFCALWAAGITVAYSIIPYKTPWLVLNIVLPLALCGGYAVEEICAIAQRSRQARTRVLWGLPVAVLLVIPVFHAVDLNFFRYDDDSIPYVYAHTRRGFLDLIKEVETIAERNGTGTHTGIVVASPNHWPMPWYLRNYSSVGYWGHAVATQEPIVIGQDDQEAQLRATLGAAYVRVGYYDLRPGVVLVLYAKRDLARF